MERHFKSGHRAQVSPGGVAVTGCVMKEVEWEPCGTLPIQAAGKGPAHAA